MSPPLQWSGIPDNVKSPVLIVADPDVPDAKAPKMTLAHWVLYYIGPTAAGLAQAVKSLPAGTREAA